MNKDALRSWMWAVLAVLFAVQFYFVRELLSALLLLAAGFSTVFTILAAVYLVHRAWKPTLSAVRMAAAAVSGLARHGFEFAEAISRKPFRRPRSLPVR